MKTECHNCTKRRPCRLLGLDLDGNFVPLCRKCCVCSRCGETNIAVWASRPSDLRGERSDDLVWTCQPCNTEAK